VADINLDVSGWRLVFLEGCVERLSITGVRDLFAMAGVACFLWDVMDD
jgi:hypothetical protein